jgi:hypothetical protein
MALAVAVGALACRTADAESRDTVCADCHETEGKQFAASVHPAGGVTCRWCHGGEESYAVERAVVERSARLLTTRPTVTTRDAADASAAFDHGRRFRGKASRYDVPERCGSCHSDVARMNPFGLPTDQWAQYRISGHGRALYERHDDRVAVCIDCHGTHEVLSPRDPASSVYPKNVPGTCGRCHADPVRMMGSQLSTRVVEEYRESVHGQGLLVRDDLGMPNCATCHGSHSAVPPGFRQIGDVCGRCHQQENQRFLQSFHAKFDLFPRCVGCHTKRVDQRDHLIQKVVASPEVIETTYERLRETMPGAPVDDRAFQEAFASLLVPPVLRVESLCERCHAASKEVGHRVFFGRLDENALRTGAELRRLIIHNELSYAAAALRVGEMSHGVLLVTDESLMVDEMRTRVVGLGPLQHTLDLTRVRDSVAEQDELHAQVDRSLDGKLRGLRWREWALLPVWVFLVVFVGALWAKYKRLKAAQVKPLPSE